MTHRETRGVSHGASRSGGGPSDVGDVALEPGWFGMLNATTRSYPANACLHDLVGRQAAANPEHVAVIHDSEVLSYGTLLTLAHGLAQRLRTCGVGLEDRVGLCARRGPELVVGMLGILEAGAAFVPLDPDYPAERLRLMLRDAGVRVLVTQDDVLGPTVSRDVLWLRLDELWAGVQEHAPAMDVRSDNLAYVIYTSGSTGTPKGIALRHSGVVNNLVDLVTRYGIGPTDRIMTLSSPSFDMCVFEVLGTLIAGGTIVTPESSGTKDPAHWADLMMRHRVTVWNSAPALLEMLVTYVAKRPELYPSTLRLALLGGDWIPVTLPDRLRALVPEVMFVSLGGATEASIHSTVFRVDPIDPTAPSIPYGRPLANQRVYVLDEECQPVPLGEPGELHIAGVGLARGYLDRPGLTAEKFVPDHLSGDPGGRMYKTGDRVRFLQDGNLQLLGRMDLQAKIRGNRVDLGEIETVLQNHSAVDRAAVVARQGRDGGSDQVVAFVVPAAGATGVDVAREVERRHVRQWEAVYENTYRDRAEDPTRNFVGWVTSHDGRPFQPAELSEALETTTDRIRSLSPRRVLEIGCGTGLVLFRIGPESERYDASDVSARAVQDLRGELADRPDLSHVTVSQRAADETEDVEPAAYDLVILNSVTQHFPDAEYLTRVLQGAARAVSPGGAIFVGDVRALPLMDLFHTTLALHRADDRDTAGGLLEQVRRSARLEKELFIDPRFFVTAGTLLSETSVAVFLKRGRHVNEITKFHYDVVVRVDGNAAGREEVARVDWTRDGITLEALGSRLGTLGGRPLRVENIPNRRVASDEAARRLLGTASGDESWQSLRRRMAQLETEERGIDPEALCDLAERHEVSAVPLWSRSGSPVRFDVVFQPLARAQLNSASLWLTASVPPATPLTNQPTRNALGAALTPQLRDHVAATLPEFMVPSAYQYLDALPLTPNGKVDRRSLAHMFEPDEYGEAPAGGHDNPVHRMMAGLWADVLGIDVSVDDNFFAIGGHSLTATQVISRVNELLGLALPLRSIFEHPSVASLCGCVEAAWRDAGLDATALAHACLEVERLTDQEAEALLLGDSETLHD